MRKINVQVINGVVFATPEPPPLDRFINCVKALEATPREGTLYEYSDRLVDVARKYYPDAYPRLICGRISSLVNERERTTQLSLF